MQERKASNIDGYFKLLNPNSGKFLTAIDSITTKIRDEQNLDQQQLEQMEEESDMELDISVVSVDFDSMTL